MNYNPAQPGFGKITMALLFQIKKPSIYTKESTNKFALICSDESEPSWLEPELELKDFQLGSARLVTFFTSARNQKLAQNEPKFDFELKTYF